MLPLRSFGVPPTASNELMMWIKPQQQTFRDQKCVQEVSTPVRRATVLALCRFGLIYIKTERSYYIAALVEHTVLDSTPGHRPALKALPPEIQSKIITVVKRPTTNQATWSWLCSFFFFGLELGDLNVGLDEMTVAPLRTFAVLYWRHFTLMKSIWTALVGCAFQKKTTKKHMIQPGSRAQQTHCEPRGTKHCWHSDVVCPWHVGNRLTSTVDIYRSNQTLVNMSAASRLLWRTSSHLENLYVSNMYLYVPSRRSTTSISPWQLLHLGFAVPESCDHASIDDWMSPQRWGIPPGISSMVHFRLAAWFWKCDTSKIPQIKKFSTSISPKLNYLEAKSSRSHQANKKCIDLYTSYGMRCKTVSLFNTIQHDLAPSRCQQASHSCDIHKSSTLSQHLEKVCTDSEDVRAKEEGGEGSRGR